MLNSKYRLTSVKSSLEFRCDLLLVHHECFTSDLFTSDSYSQECIEIPSDSLFPMTSWLPARQGPQLPGFLGASPCSALQRGPGLVAGLRSAARLALALPGSGWAALGCAGLSSAY